MSCDPETCTPKAFPFGDDQQVSVLVRQTKKVGDSAGSGTCKSGSDWSKFCSENQKYWSMQPCPADPLAYSAVCTDPDGALCEIKDSATGEIFTGDASWEPNRSATDLTVRCTYPATFFLAQDEASVDVATPKIRAFMNQFVTGEFATENQNSIQDSLFPNLCFSTGCQCRFDPTNVSTEHPAGKQLCSCSTIHATTELGGMCNTWYKSTYGPAMENYVQRYAEQNPSLADNDLRCANRHQDLAYRQLVDSIGVATSPGCYWNACTPDAPQLKPSQFIMTPECPQSVCASIMSVINYGDSSGSSYNVQQNVSCSSVEAYEQATFDSKAFLNSLILSIVIAGFALIIFLICALIV